MSDESNVCMTCDIVWVPKEAYSASIAQIESLMREKAELRAQNVEDGQRITTLRAELDAAKELPPMVAPMPTNADAVNILRTVIGDSIKATSVLSTMLRKLNLQGYAVADELLGNLQVAHSIAERLIDTARARPGTAAEETR